MLGIIFIAALAAAAATLDSLAGRRSMRAILRLGACFTLFTCGLLLLQSWNRAVLRANQWAPATQTAK